MPLRRLDLRGFTGDLSGALPAPADEQERSSAAVATIIWEVRSGGDEAGAKLGEASAAIARLVRS